MLKIEHLVKNFGDQQGSERFKPEHPKRRNLRFAWKKRIGEINDH